MTADANATEHKPPLDPNSGDWFLGSLVNAANANDTEIGITLLTGGFLVSGLLVGGAKYFEACGQDFDDAFPADQDSKESLRQVFSVSGEIYKQDETTTLAPPGYIHLKQARFYSTNGMPIPGNRVVWWRGRLTEISGFSPGSLNAAQS
jgi:hypothetical protein